MKQYLFILLIVSSTAATAQLNSETPSLPPVAAFSLEQVKMPAAEANDIQLQPKKWKFTSNHIYTGALVFTAGMAKGFNETLQFHWKAFKRKHPGANPNWYNPAVSWKNKYENNDPKKGAKFPLSTSVLVMLTDQYHLNNFIIRMSWGTALVIKLGEKKKPLKNYLLDMLYYTGCFQAGFGIMYYPYKQ